MQSRHIDISSFDGKQFKGYLSLPPAGRGPGIVLIQEIFGVNPHIRAVADQYAMDGFVVLAPDVFWRQEPGLQLEYGESDFSKALGFMQRMDLGSVMKDLAATVKALRALPECEGKIASLGFCMGGLLSFLCAVEAGVDAAVSYYPGGIDQHLHKGAGIDRAVLLHFAEQDHFISQQAIEAVERAFAGNSQVHVQRYPAVDHGFNCWERPAYHQASAARARGRTLQFLADVIC